MDIVLSLLLSYRTVLKGFRCFKILGKKKKRALSSSSKSMQTRMFLNISEFQPTGEKEARDLVLKAAF